MEQRPKGRRKARKPRNMWRRTIEKECNKENEQVGLNPDRQPRTKMNGGQR